MFSKFWKPSCLCFIFVGILSTAFLIRAQGIKHIPSQQFTEIDGYFYLWQAQLVSEHGRMPERDMHRWLPLGRDTGQTLNLYPYVLAYTHKVISAMFAKVTLYDVSVYAPAFCFVISLAVLCLFLYITFNPFVAGIVGIILATLPGSVERSTVGFGDRDSWCLMVAILAVTFYLASLNTQKPKHKLAFTIASGIAFCCGCLSWEGFGIFPLIFVFLELWRFITSETETKKDLWYYFLWILMFVPTLFIFSSPYRSGYGFSKHLTVFVLIPPLVILFLRCLRIILMTKRPFADKFQHGRSIAFSFTLVSIFLALIYVLIQYSTFQNTTVALSQNELMLTVTELRNPFFRYWVHRYGGVFVFGSLGLIVASLIYWKKLGMFFAVPITLFALTVFGREPLNALINEPVITLLFSVATLATIIAFLFIGQRRTEPSENELTFVAFAIWFVVWVVLARGAKRYDFFIGVPLAFFTAFVLQSFSDFVANRLRNSVYTTEKFREDVSHNLINAICTICLLATLLFWSPMGAHAKLSIHAATKMRMATPGRTNVSTMFLWLKKIYLKTVDNPEDVIFAAHWGYGSQLNVMANVKTIIDQDHFIQHWIHLYQEHVYNATSEQEALEFLKAHGVTHLMLGPRDPKKTFLHNKLSDAFVPIYPITKFDQAKVKIWKIQYPADIKTKSRYLKTEFQ